MLKYVQGNSFRRAKGIIFLTRYAQMYVGRLLGGLPQAAALVPHGIEPRFLRAPRMQRQLSECTEKRPFELLYVSILMPYKHQKEVALAIHKLRLDGMALRMRFVGATHGDYGKEFTALLNQLDPHGEFLVWTGSQPFEVVHSFYRNADGFVFASSCENLPNILIEAMAAGLPIASSDRGPMPEILGEAGIYFDPESPESIADALRLLVQSPPNRLRLANLAWSKAQAYSWRKCANDTFAFLAKVAATKD
jgi:glycosyltransferase involved in cell wall biosynthesis